MINKNSYSFKTFVEVRIVEIQDTTNTCDWYWVEVSNNIADWITRKKCPVEISELIIWQKGPKFMRYSIDHWCIKSTMLQGDLPEEIQKVSIALIQENCTLVNVIDINRYSKYRMLMQITARILQVARDVPKPSLKNIFQYPSVDTLKTAEDIWVRDAQQTIIHKLKGGHYDRLCPIKDEKRI